DHAAGSLNVRAAYLEVMADALSSLGVIVASVIIVITGWTQVDALVSALIAVLIVPRTWSLLRQALNVLLEGTPSHLSLAEIEAAMVAVEGVRRVHDLHVWTLTSGREAMSAHVVVEDVRESDRLLEALHGVLHARFGIDHTTMQIETGPPAVWRIKTPSSPGGALGRFGGGGRGATLTHALDRVPPGARREAGGQAPEPRRHRPRHRC